MKDAKPSQECGGVCIRHGAQVIKRCSSDGCNNYVINRGVCIRHGAMVKLSKAKVVQTMLYLKEECA